MSRSYTQSYSRLYTRRRFEPAVDEPLSWYGMSSIFRPFSPALWLGILLLVLGSGFTDYAVERVKTHENTLTASLYEYCAGFLWGGFEYPLSKTSAVFQVFLGFVTVVVTAACASPFASKLGGVFAPRAAKKPCIMLTLHTCALCLASQILPILRRS